MATAFDAPPAFNQVTKVWRREWKLIALVWRPELRPLPVAAWPLFSTSPAFTSNSWKVFEFVLEVFLATEGNRNTSGFSGFLLSR
jgi:hypothetical protein